MQIIESDDLIELIERAEALQLRISSAERLINRGDVEVSVSMRDGDEEASSQHWLRLIVHHGQTAKDIVVGALPAVRAELAAALADLAGRGVKLSPPDDLSDC